MLWIDFKKVPLPLPSHWNVFWLSSNAKDWWCFDPVYTLHRRAIIVLKKNDFSFDLAQQLAFHEKSILYYYCSCSMRSQRPEKSENSRGSQSNERLTSDLIKHEFIGWKRFNGFLVAKSSTKYSEKSCDVKYFNGKMTEKRKTRIFFYPKLSSHVTRLFYPDCASTFQRNVNKWLDG